MHAQRAGQLTEVERSACGDDDEHAELHERDLVLDSAIDRAITETRTREARIAASTCPLASRVCRAA